MEDRRVPREVKYEVERERNVPPRKAKPEGVLADGEARARDVIEEVGGERAEDVESRETIVERRTR